MKKRILVTLIAVCAILFAFGMTNASAETEGIYTYYVSNGKAIIEDCSESASGEITIPDTLGGYPVTRIGAWAFSDCSSIESITIPDSVTSIIHGAFLNCTNLKKVNITDLKAWCNIDFQTHDSNPLYYAGELYLYGNLVTDITIPDSVTTIGNYAFINCISLKSITIPDNVTLIGVSAFQDCSSLESVTIPNSVTYIDKRVFSGCSSLENIIVDKDNPSYISIDGVLFDKNKTILIRYPTRKTDVEYIIPDSVTSISDFAFNECGSLSSITIPDSVTSIGTGAFSYCSSLSSITIPRSVTSIGDTAFYGCRSLVNITLPDEVTTIGYMAFHNCISLKSITIPDNVTTISASAFSNCRSLISITIPDSVTIIASDAFDGCSRLADIYYNGTEVKWGEISIGTSNESLTNATIHFIQDEKEKYFINSITIKDMSGNSLQATPTGTFLATVSFTNVSSTEDTVIVLAQYTDTGAFKGLMYIQTEDVPIGSTIKLSIPVDNTNGDIAKLKAFCWDSFGSMTPLGNSASYPL